MKILVKILSDDVAMTTVIAKEISQIIKKQPYDIVQYEGIAYIYYETDKKLTREQASRIDDSWYVPSWFYLVPYSSELWEEWQEAAKEEFKNSGNVMSDCDIEVSENGSVHILGTIIVTPARTVTPFEDWLWLEHKAVLEK